MTKYFTVLDVGQVKSDPANGKVYLGIAECTAHSQRLLELEVDPAPFGGVSKGEGE